MNLAKRILDKADALPALPRVVTQVLDLTSDPDFAMSELVAMVSLDPAITAKVLRRVNSSFFGLVYKVTSLEQALPHIGSRQLVEIVLDAGVGPMYKGGQDGYLLPPGQLWRHSLATALAAGWVGRTLAYADAPTLHTAALLHDVGKLVMAEFVRERFEAMGRLVVEDGISLMEAEKRVLGLNHAELGALVAKKWRLPKAIRTAILYHHDPRPAEEARELANLTALANYLAEAAGHGARLGVAPPSPPVAAVLAFELDPPKLRRLVTQTREHLDKARELLELAA